MAGSIDLNTNKGIMIVLLSAGLVGGGASVIQNRVFGPGGEWQRVVTNQAVIQEQIKTTNQSFEKLSQVLENGFEKVAESTDRQNTQLSEIQDEMDNYKFELQGLKTRMSSLEQYRQELMRKGTP